MTRLSRAMLMAALMAGVSLTATVPASAKKKEEPAQQGPQLNLNQKVRESYAAALAAINAAVTARGPGGVTAANQASYIAGLEAAAPYIDAAQAAATNNDELYVVQELRYQQQSRLLSAREFGKPASTASANSILGPLIDKLLANPVTPKDSVQKYAMDRARMQYLSNEFRPALANLQRAQAAGSTDPLLGPMLVDTYVKLQDYSAAAAESDKMTVAMKAAGQPVPEAFYAIGIENAYRSKNPAGAVAYEQKRLAEYPSAKNFHDALIRLMDPSRSGIQFDTRQRLDVFRLLRASKALGGEKEIQLYAYDATEAAASREAFAVLEEFRAGRPVTVFDANTLQVYNVAKARAGTATPVATVEAAARKGTDAQSALTAANFNYVAGNFAKAIEFYQLAQQRGAPDKDALLMSLGASQAQTGDKAAALATFAQIQSSPRKEVAGYWRIWLEQTQPWAGPRPS